MKVMRDRRRSLLQFLRGKLCYICLLAAPRSFFILADHTFRPSYICVMLTLEMGRVLRFGDR